MTGEQAKARTVRTDVYCEMVAKHGVRQVIALLVDLLLTEREERAEDERQEVAKCGGY